MAEYLTNDTLDNDFVTRATQLLRLVLDIDDDLLGPCLVLSMIELHTLKFPLDALFNDVANLSWVETFVFTRLHSIGWEVRHARATKIDHLIKFVSFFNN